MAVVSIKNKKETDKGWEFLVEIVEEDSEVEIKVELDRTYWEKLTQSKTSPEELVKSSVEFLLQREPKESILREFNLQAINRYFPEYEREIIKTFKK